MIEKLVLFLTTLSDNIQILPKWCEFRPTNYCWNYWIIW